MRLKTSKLKRAVAVLAATCTLGTCCVAGSIAWAADEHEAGANTGNISPTCGVKNGAKTCTSITIHKYDGGASTTKATGTTQTVQNRNAVKGVEFTLYKVTLTADNDENAKKIDLSKAEGWKKIEDIQKLDPASKNAASFFEGNQPKFIKTKVGEAKKTDENGKVEFKDLDESLYYVEESDTKDAQIKDGEKWKSVTVTGKVDPFFITTPLPHKTENSWEWLYKVDVYPKNDTSNDVPTKTPKDPTKLYVADDGSTVIPWDISIPLVPPSDNQSYKQIGFIDSLPEGLTYDSVSDVKLVKTPKTPAGSKATDVTLSKTTDYTVTSTAKAESTPAKVEFNLSASRLTSLSADFKNSTYVLKVTLKTKVAKGTKNVTNSINGWIDNSKIGGDGDKEHPCVPTKEKPCDKNPHGTSHFATLKITKVAIDANKKNTNKTLKGAKFAIYSVKDKDTTLTDITKGNLDSKADKVMTNGNAEGSTQLTIETGDDGTAKVDLFIANDDKTQSRKYCLVETDAPAGFKKDPTPHCYAVNAETDTNVTDGVATGNSQTIGNDQATELDKILGNLPMTGARGLVILTVCGIVGIAGTLFYIVMKRRKEQEQE